MPMTCRFLNCSTLLLSLGLLLPATAAAQSAIYRCDDGKGHVEFTDVSRSGCTLLEQIPAPRASAPIPAPRRVQGGSPSAPAATVPGGFPRVDPAQQRSRDDERRAILTEELNMELQKLATLREQFNEGAPERQGNERNYAKYQERVEALRAELARTERNIEALRREIGNLR